jgi:hypothetical protein
MGEGATALNAQPATLEGTIWGRWGNMGEAPLAGTPPSWRRRKRLSNQPCPIQRGRRAHQTHPNPSCPLLLSLHSSVVLSEALQKFYHHSTTMSSCCRSWSHLLLHLVKRYMCTSWRRRSCGAWSNSFENITTMAAPHCNNVSAMRIFKGMNISLSLFLLSSSRLNLGFCLHFRRNFLFSMLQIPSLAAPPQTQMVVIGLSTEQSEGMKLRYKLVWWILSNFLWSLLMSLFLFNLNEIICDYFCCGCFRDRSWRVSRDVMMHRQVCDRDVHWQFEDEQTEHMSEHHGIL